MLERFTSVVKEGNIVRAVFTSNPEHVTVEVQSKTSDKIVVRITPLPAFSEEDYLIEVTYEKGSFATGYKNLVGSKPDWMNDPIDFEKVADHMQDAKLIASSTVGI